MRRHVIDLVEILKTVETPEGEWDVCATGEGGYDAETGKLRMKLDAYLRTTDIRKHEEPVRAKWLPHPEECVEGVSEEDASEMAREIFAGWIKKVRRGMPETHHVTL